MAFLQKKVGSYSLRMITQDNRFSVCRKNLLYYYAKKFGEAKETPRNYVLARVLYEKHTKTTVEIMHFTITLSIVHLADVC